MRPIVTLLLVPFVLHSGCSTAQRMSDGDMATVAGEVDSVKGQGYGIEVVILSRGRGVPEKTLETYRRIRALASEEARRDPAITQREQIVGLEGERRLCISAPDPVTGSELYARIQALSADLDLMRISADGCRAD